MKCVRKFSQRFPLQSILNEKFCLLDSSQTVKPAQTTRRREYLTHLTHLTASLSPGFCEAAPNLRSSLHVGCAAGEKPVFQFRSGFADWTSPWDFTVEYTNNNKPLQKGYHLNTIKYEAFSKSPMSRCLSLSALASPPRSMWGWWVHQLPPGKDLHRHNESCG